MRYTELEMDLEKEFIPTHHLRWDIYGTEATEGVDPLKVQHKYQLRWDVYGAEDESGDNLTPQSASGWTEVKLSS